VRLVKVLSPMLLFSVPLWVLLLFSMISVGANALGCYLLVGRWSSPFVFLFSFGMGVCYLIKFGRVSKTHMAN